MIDHPEDYRAALYIRLSKEDERDGPSQSVTNQESLLRAFAQREGLEVQGVYVDDGWSGTNFDRPGFQRLLADIEAKRVDLVLTKDLSRLGRDYILTGHYLERYFPEHRVRYISLLDGIDTGVESSANDVTPFRAIMNDMYAKDISKKIRSVKHDKQRKGEFIGGKPVFGYRMDPARPGAILPDEGAAPVVRRIFALALSGESCRRIAARLTEEGVRTPGAYAAWPSAHPGAFAGRWSAECVSRLLQNETYVGSMVQGRSARAGYKTKKCLHRRSADWVVVPGTHEPLVDRATFEAVARLIASRRSTRSRTHDFLLKGLIFCRECGRPLGVLARQNSRGETVLYLSCPTYRRWPKAGLCTSHLVAEQAVTQAVLAQLRADLAPWLTAEHLRPLAAQTLAEERRTWPETRDETRAAGRIAHLNDCLDRAYMDRLNGALPAQDYERIAARLRAERESLESQRTPRMAATDAAETAERLADRFAQSALEDRELLCRLVERIELTAEKQVLLHYRAGEMAARLPYAAREVSRVEKHAVELLREAISGNANPPSPPVP